MGPILISGSTSGLGRYLRSRFNATGFDRTVDINAYASTRFDAIIHCAFNPQRNPTNLDAYFDDNTHMTERLAQLRAGKFVYLSSVDVYMRDGQRHDESSTIDETARQSPYGLSKVLSERLVRTHCRDHLILRPTGILGNMIRPTTLTRMLTSAKPQLTLAPDSILNFINHSDIGDFIEIALKDSVSGTYNIAAKESATLHEIADSLSVHPQYGDYFYDIGRVDIRAAQSIMPALGRGTLENVRKFAADYRNGSVRLLNPA